MGQGSGRARREGGFCRAGFLSRHEAFTRRPRPWYYGFYSTLTKSLNRIKYFQLKDGRGWHSYNKMEDAQTSLSAPTPFQIINK